MLARADAKEMTCSACEPGYIFLSLRRRYALQCRCFLCVFMHHIRTHYAERWLTATALLHAQTALKKFSAPGTGDKASPNFRKDIRQCLHFRS